ncbi:MAG: hypothetical protein ACFFDF_06210, partial [Candidatus Odinarchaeota archaeon]
NTEDEDTFDLHNYSIYDENMVINTDFEIVGNYIRTNSTVNYEIKSENHNIILKNKKKFCCLRLF